MHPTVHYMGPRKRREGERDRRLFKEIISFVGCRTITAIVEIVLMNIFVTSLQFNYMIMKIIVNVPPQ